MAFVKVKVSEASGPALDWLVAKCEGTCFEKGNHLATPAQIMASWLRLYAHGDDHYSTDWAQGGPIIEREKIDCVADPNGKDAWMGQLYATRLGGSKVIRAFGPTLLIAAMRCYVASKLGDEAEVPEELLP